MGPEEKGAEAEFDADALKDRIFGSHVAEYMETMEEEDQQKYEAHFAKYIEAGVGADDIKDMIKECHDAIRENPVHEKKEKRDIKNVRSGCKVTSGDKVYTRQKKRSKAEKRGRVKAKIQNAMAKALEAAEEE